MKNKLFEMYSTCPEDFERFVAALRETYRYDPTTGVMSRLKSSGALELAQLLDLIMVKAIYAARSNDRYT